MRYLVLFLLTIHVGSSSAQIKEQFVATEEKNTTVVIKENNSSDQDILAQSFNLDDYRVGDVIRITTVNDVREKPEKKAERASAGRSSYRKAKKKKRRGFKLFGKRLKQRKFRKANFRQCYSF